MNKAEAELELRRGTSQAKKIQQQLDGLESQINNLVSVVASGNKSDAILERLNSLEGQRVEVERQLIDLEGTEDNSMTREEITTLVRNFKEDIQNAEPHAIRDYLRAVVDSITFYPDGRIVFASAPFEGVLTEHTFLMEEGRDYMKAKG